MHVAQRIKRLERDEAAFDAVLADVRAADLVLWATPVYYFLVPGQVKRLVELVDGRGDDFDSFHDHLAHDYLAGICEDWGMRFYGAHSAEMWDLLGTEGRAQFHRFAEGLFAAVAQDAVTPASHAPLIPHDLTYTPGPPPPSAGLPLLTAGAGRALRPLIIADGLARSPNLAQIDALLDDLAVRGVAWATTGYQRPASFLGEGGHKLFRDRIWGDLRFVFQADHRRYRATGFYDFPQRKIGVRLLNLFAPLVRLPFIRKRFVPRITDSMVMPFQRVVEAE